MSKPTVMFHKATPTRIYQMIEILGHYYAQVYEILPDEKHYMPIPVSSEFFGYCDDAVEYLKDCIANGK